MHINPETANLFFPQKIKGGNRNHARTTNHYGHVWAMFNKRTFGSSQMRQNKLSALTVFKSK